MAFDIKMIEKVYDNLATKIEAARKLTNKPLTLTEKILYSHLAETLPSKPFERGNSYVDFNPDRVCQM
jgi:aconitate hydratase